MSQRFADEVKATVTQWLTDGLVIRWVPWEELGRTEVDGRGLFVNRTEIDPAMGMEISAQCGKRGAFKVVERDGFGYVELR